MRGIEELTEASYEYGFSTDLDTDVAPPGLTEDTVRLISSKKDEPEWLLEWRLKAFAAWQEMEEPDWAKLKIAPIDYQSISYWAAPKQKPVLDSMDDVDPDIREMFDKLGIPLHEQKMLSNVAVDAIVDSVSVTTTFKATLAEAGVIFCSFSEAVQDYPELIKEHLGSVVPVRDNFFAALNSAVFSDGSFCYIPKGVRCPMELSTYFRINSMNTGQFERTLIVAEDDSHVSYLEGCTAPQRDENQLHAAVVELVAKDRAEIKYSTVQNCAHEEAKISWTQVETGSAITWKYPSVILQGDRSIGSAENARNYTQCDSLLIGKECGAHTVPYIEVKNPTAQVEHEASTSTVGEDQLYYCRQRGMNEEDAMAMIVNGFCREVFDELPMEFAVEAQRLLSVSLEGSVG
ncbi:UNVERIFIED_CONTAM: hypothetical protein GTU68_048619 [Idotea baltica]|nr:hypothetical protein [Idotea baltica]